MNPSRLTKPESKAKPADGIFLYYAPGNPEVWETFSNQYLARTRSLFGRVYEEVESGTEIIFEHNRESESEEEEAAEMQDEDEDDDDLPGPRPFQDSRREEEKGPDQGDAAAEDPQLAEMRRLNNELRDQIINLNKLYDQSKIKEKRFNKGIKKTLRLERLKLDLKAEDQLVQDRSRFIGDLLLHLSFSSERHLRDHEDFEVAYSSPIYLWGILRAIHLTPQHAGQISLWEARDKLMQCKQPRGSRITPEPFANSTKG
jgi:hypothetical protein